MTAQPAEIAWAAGLFEGEGHAGVTKSAGRFYPRASLSSTDEDVVRRFHFVAGVGTVIGPRRQNGLGQKPFWTWRASGKALIPLLKQLQPWLGVRRSAQAEKAIKVSNESVVVDRYAVGDRYKSTVAWRLFGKRFSDLTVQEHSAYTNRRRKRV